MKILLATYNEHKKKEFEALFAPAGIQLVSLRDVGFDEEIIEDGRSFMENAVIKAERVFSRTGLPTLADDSGISIDALDGRPGIHSARFLGQDTPAQEKNRQILELLKGKGNRGAHYTCALAYIAPGRRHTIERECHGRILDEQQGTEGFGYDPIFLVEAYGKTMAELPLSVKNEISHRGLAIADLKEYFRKNNIT